LVLPLERIAYDNQKNLVTYNIDFNGIYCVICKSLIYYQVTTLVLFYDTEDNPIGVENVMFYFIQ